MAKARLTAVTEKWIDGKTEKHLNVKTIRHEKCRRMQTLYLSEEAIKLLWHNRVETGETLSDAAERLVLEHLKRK